MVWCTRACSSKRRLGGRCRQARRVHITR
ncbi:MAG: hypothetical protein GWP91_07215 [Rhodobacterales bacterium]|nr:hypothetical protein [Rhodobacterales bacterium]